MIKQLKRRFNMWLSGALEKPAEKCVAGCDDDYWCALRDCDDCPCIIAIFPKWFTKILVRRQRRKEDEMIRRLEAIDLTWKD